MVRAAFSTRDKVFIDACLHMHKLLLSPRILGHGICATVRHSTPLATNSDDFGSSRKTCAGWEEGTNRDLGAFGKDASPGEIIESAGSKYPTRQYSSAGKIGALWDEGASRQDATSRKEKAVASRGVRPG